MSPQSLADIIDTLHREQHTGVLSVTVKNDNNQLKLFFRTGTVYFVTYSTCRNLECIIRLGSLVTDRAFFLPGAKVDVPHSITLSTEEIIQRVRSLNKTIAWDGTSAQSRQNTGSNAGAADIPAERIAGLEAEILDLIGPMGTIVFQSALDTCHITGKTAISKPAFQELVRTISVQMPEVQRKQFLSRHAF